MKRAREVSSAPVVPLEPIIYLAAWQDSWCRDRNRCVFDCDVELFKTAEEAKKVVVEKKPKARTEEEEEFDPIEEESGGFFTHIGNSDHIVKEEEEEEEDHWEDEEEVSKKAAKAKEVDDVIKAFELLNAEKLLPRVLPRDIIHLIGEKVKCSWGKHHWLGHLPEGGEYDHVYAFSLLTLVPTYDFTGVLKAGVIFAASDSRAIQLARNRFVFEVDEMWRDGFTKVVSDTHEYGNARETKLPSDAPREWSAETCDQFTAEWMGLCWDCCDDNMGSQVPRGPAIMKLFRFDKNLKNKTLVREWPTPTLLLKYSY